MENTPTHVPAPSSPLAVGAQGVVASAAFERLSGDEGPPRFSTVNDKLYRGGQPSVEQLQWLHDLGVRRIINLRRERIGLRLTERREARQLGLEIVEFPFYGVFGADKKDLDTVIDAMHPPSIGSVYIHCKNGRDRTSLLVALYRVCIQGWAPQDAWEQEVIAYDHDPTRFYRKIATTFDEVVAQHLAEQ